MDISCVQSIDQKVDIDKMIFYAKQYQFITAFTLPCFTPYVKEHLKNESAIKLGGVVGFPTGCDSTASKIYQLQELIQLGCQEIDMVMAYSMLQSDFDSYVFHDMEQVIKAAGTTPVKVIIEAPLLTDIQLEKACNMAIEAGASFIKSSTGWIAKPTTTEVIRKMAANIKGQVPIKAAGGIRSLETVKEMLDLGCERFGVSVNSAVKIIEEAKKEVGEN